MATPRDLIDELGKLTTTNAQRLIDAPTGVTPGYHAALGGTVDAAGRLRYVGGVTTPTPWTALQLAEQSFDPGDLAVINFETVGDDPYVGGVAGIEVGTGWLFNSHLPNDAWAIVTLHVVVHYDTLADPGDSDDFQQGDLMRLWWGRTGAASINELELVAAHAVGGTSEANTALLHGTILTTLPLLESGSSCAYITYESAGVPFSRLIGGSTTALRGKIGIVLI